MKHLKKFNESKKETIVNKIANLNPGKELEVVDNFKKFDKMFEKIQNELKNNKIVGNTTADLGNQIGQTIYEFLDDEYFSEEDFIWGFKHGIDTMKKPSKSKWHNFNEAKIVTKDTTKTNFNIGSDIQIVDENDKNKGTAIFKKMLKNTYIVIYKGKEYKVDKKYLSLNIHGQVQTNFKNLK